MGGVGPAGPAAASFSSPLLLLLLLLPASLPPAKVRMSWRLAAS